MRWRGSVYHALNIPRPATCNRFTMGRTFPICNSKFMLNRLQPLGGWYDRMSGFYEMKHNKHVTG